jgi:hypothetical protein
MRLRVAAWIAFATAGPIGGTWLADPGRAFGARHDVDLDCISFKRITS